MTFSKTFRTRLASGAAAAGLVLLAACGGGGTNSTPAPTPAPTPRPSPTPTPAPSPTPAPVPTPTPTSAELRYVLPPLPSNAGALADSEFANSDGPRFHGAATAWVKGNTGRSRTIAIIDTGIMTGEPDLAGRISSNSTGINGNTTHQADAAAQDESLHGTEVALIAAAANNNRGTVGMAYDATIMAIRADDPGSCAETKGCTFGDLSKGIDWAVDHGATVINMSLGGATATGSEVAAVRKAANAGIVVVVAAGNDRDDEPDSFARALAEAKLGNVIIVGSVGAGGTISRFSNEAGDYGSTFIMALGETLSIDETAAIYTTPGQFQISGTSFAAPQVSGAVALIKQAFPSMTAAQIVDLLISTAQDVGKPGVDSTYGSGILDIHEAFQPQGTTSLAGSKTPLRYGDDTGVTSASMGDAVEGVSLHTLVLDRFSRAFTTELGHGLSTARLSQRLQGAVGQEQRFVSLDAGKAALAFTLDSSDKARQPWPKQLMLSREDADAAKVLAARVAMKLSPTTDFGFAYAESADGLVGQLQGQARPAFLIAQSATGDDGLFRSTDAAFALRRKLGKVALTVSAESGEIVSAAPLLMARDAEAQARHDGVRSFAVAADRRFGPLEGTLGVTFMDEDRTVLGARFHDGFGAGGAATAFIDAQAGLRFADGWRFGAAWRQGVTRPNAGGIITSDSLIETRAWSLDVQRQGVFGGSDSLALRFAQPLRVESGGLGLNLPVDYSYDTMLPTYETRTLSLTPHGRELMGEIAWRGPLFFGFGSASVYYRRDPGHYAALPDDKGVALKWDTKF